MNRTLLLVAGTFVAATVFHPIWTYAHEAKPAAVEKVDNHDDPGVKLSDKKIEAGNFAVQGVREGVLNKYISVPGSVVPSSDRIAKVAVKLLGTVLELRKQLGETVRAGEVLAIIESRDVADAKGEYLAAHQVFNLQQTLFNRSKSLFESKVLSENDFLRARTSFEEVRIKLDVARQKLFALGLTEEQITALPQQPVATLRQQELRAPISGRLAERRVDLGSLVGREGQESELFVIVDLSVVWAELSISTADLAVVSEGQRITLSTGVGRDPFPAVIMFVSPLLDKDTRFARVVASVDNAAHALKPGTFVTAEIPFAPTPAGVLVPKTALQTINGNSVVFVRTATGFEPRKITTGRDDSHSFEVTSGLSAGEQIATANTFTLKADLGKGEAEHGH